MKSHVLRFSQMNSDVADKFLPEGHYRKMRNCRPNNVNSKSGGVVENIPSTLAITPPSFGQTVTYKGGCVDAKRDAIIAFYKGTTNKSLFITSLNTKTKVESFVMRSTVIDITKRVTHSGVMGDFLFWIDGENKIRKINIVTATANDTLNYFSASQTLIDKLPPLYPPTCVASQDTSFVGNNISNSIFQFAYAYEYDGHEISSWSPLSKSVLPATSDDINYLNNKIAVAVNTGDSSVKKIRIAYRKKNDGEWSLTDILDKAELSIADDTTYAYSFYNNKFIAQEVKTDVLSTTYNGFYEAGTIALSRDNFPILGYVKDGLEKPTGISLTLNYSILSSSTKKAGFKFGAIHEFGVVFRDENGRTDGVNARTEVAIPFFTDASIQSTIAGISTSNLIPYADITWSISGSAPSWAKTVSIVYLGNKTLSSFVDYTLSGIEDVGDYTYFDLEALNSLKDTVSVLDPGTPSVNISAYTFTKGDRIRFITDKDGVVLTDTSSYEKFDYEILGEAPNITDSSGKAFYPNNIYINKIGDWSANNLGKGSVFEIYSPKKEFADSIFFEIGEVFQCVDGTIMTTSGTLETGDVYCFRRDMSQYEVGELIADERTGKETAYEYPKDFDDTYGGVGFTPQLNVLKNATGIQQAGYAQNDPGGAFYRNTSGEEKIITVTGTYEFTTESSRGYSFILRRSTLSANVQDYVIYTEAHHTNALTGTYQGTINQQITVPNGQYVSLYFDNADEKHARLIIRNAPKIQISVKITDSPYTPFVSFVESKNYSDYFESDEHSFGRPYVEINDIDTGFKNVLVYGGRYFEDTQINETNRIEAINVKQVPTQYGAISAMCVRGDVLKVFTPYKEMSFYLGKEQYSDGQSTNNFVLSSNPIGTINVYDSDYGTENPESLLTTSSAVYYYDRKNKQIISTGNNGQIDINRYSFNTRLKEITNRVNAATQYNVFIADNVKNKEILTTFVIDGVAETIVFKWEENKWTHDLDYEDTSANAPQGFCNLGETLAMYKGQTYLVEQGTTYNEFFGDQKDAIVECVMNNEPINTKVLQAFSYQNDGEKWQIEAETDTINNYPYGMYTKATKGRQNEREGIIFVDCPPNLKTKQGVVKNSLYATGTPMRGRYANVKLTNTETTRQQLDEFTVNYDNSAIQ